MRPNLGVWLTVLLCGTLLAACQDRESAGVPPAPACKLTVGWDPWEPYQYEDADGTVRGMDIEIVELLAKDVGCEPRYLRGNWLEFLQKLKDGEVDVLLAGTVIPERERYAWFSQPYRQESFALFVRKDDLAATQDKDLQALAAAGKRIGITEGYYYGADVNRMAYESPLSKSFVSASVVELNYSRLADGTIDALLDDPFVGAAVLRRKGLSGTIVRHPLSIASGKVSLMFSRKSVSEDQVKRFDAALAKRQQDGSLEAVLKKYRG
ncbi:MAG: amino acid ABC transporter substrate-binding protein [Gammaproteobacteria bacterium]|nr:amino acid ABC transporter substrate-binding protein [Gammaproteobacteria bacterium]